MPLHNEEGKKTKRSVPGPVDGGAKAEQSPIPSSPSKALFGSDAIAEALRELDVPYIALNPGASYRGLHDSLINHLGNQRPQMLLCLHEEHAIAIGQGYAKVTDKPLAAVVHSNVGLMHATMAIFNAWCDRMPVIILGATGPLDAAKRRPWIDWIHTARDQGALIRSYVKYDDQPASPEAAREALYRAAWIAQTAPRGPVYINLDAEIQEQALEKPLEPLTSKRFMPSVSQGPSPEAVSKAASALSAARRPLILAGRVSRSIEGWRQRVALAETLQSRVATDLRIGAAFPTDHPLHVGDPAVFPSSDLQQAVREADVILSLDWVDLAGALKGAGPNGPDAQVIQVSLDHAIHNGWSMDHQAHPPVDMFVAADPDAMVAALTQQLNSQAATDSGYQPRPENLDTVAKSDLLTTEVLTAAVRRAVGDRDVSLLHLPLSWNGALWHFRHPLAYLGSDGGGGIGGGPGIAVGAALALKGSGRLPLAMGGDGDFLMGATALWTAVHYKIPLLYVIANNRSFYNDEVHQERVARHRDRPVENKWIGQRMADPEIDLAGLARSQGAEGFGPVHEMAELPDILAAAIAATDAGKVAVVDVRVEPGYSAAMLSGLTRAK